MTFFFLISLGIDAKNESESEKNESESEKTESGYMIAFYIVLRVCLFLIISVIVLCIWHRKKKRPVYVNSPSTLGMLTHKYIVK